MGSKSGRWIKRCATAASPVTDLQWCSKNSGYGGYLGYRRLNSSISAPFPLLLA